MMFTTHATIHLTFYRSHKLSNNLPALYDDLKYPEKNNLQLYLVYNPPHQILYGEQELMYQYTDYET